MMHFFILGNPRSGTSLLRIMLNQHPQVISPPECGFAHWWLQKYERWNLSDLSSLKIGSFLDDLLGSKKIETWNLDRGYLFEIITARRPSNYGALVDCVYQSYKKRHPEHAAPSVIVDKNNYYINHLDDLTRIWQDAGYIFLIRDGRDVACSYLDVNKIETNSPYKPKLPTSINEIAIEWDANNQRIISFLNHFDCTKFIKVKYEDLILKTRETLQSVADFIGVSFSEAMLSYYMQDAEFLKEPAKTLDWKKKTLEKPDLNQVGRYRNVLSGTQIEIFNQYALKTLQDFSYV